MSFFPLRKILPWINPGNTIYLKTFLSSSQECGYIHSGLQSLNIDFVELLREEVCGFINSPLQCKMYKLKEPCLHPSYHYCSIQVITAFILCFLTTNHHYVSPFFSTSLLFWDHRRHNYIEILRVCQAHLPTSPSFTFNGCQELHRVGEELVTN